jgi:hypothetical protein
VSISYADALELALQAMRRGEDPESVVARWPEHADALRDDLRLRDSLQRYGATLPQAADAARTAASTRLMAQLQAGRTARIQAQSRPLPWYRRFGLPRLAAATAVVALALIAVGFFSLRGGGTNTAEAATLEGVVLDNTDGNLTIQTLDTLEQVTVPADAQVSTADGSRISLDGIQVGQVVQVNGLRRKGVVQAARIQRLADDVSKWCNDDSVPCQTLADKLNQAEQQCRDHPAICGAQIQRVTELRDRVAALAVLNNLKTRCQNREANACQAVVTFCEQHLDLCGGVVPQLPSQDGQGGSLRDRLNELQQQCDQRDTAACRRLQQFCDNNPGVCGNTTPASPDTAPNVTPDASSRSDSRPVTASPTREPRPTLTPVRRPR